MDRLRESDIGAGDRGCAGATVCLEDVAVYGKGALAEEVELGDGAERAADEALDLGGAPRASAGLAGGAGVSGAGEHAVFGGDPAGAAADGEAGQAVLDRDGAEDARLAHVDEGRALGMRKVAGDNRRRAQFVGPAAVAADHTGAEYSIGEPRAISDQLSAPALRTGQMDYGKRTSGI